MSKAEPYELHDAQKLIAFAQAMLKFAPVAEDGLSVSDTLELIRYDFDELETLFDLYKNCYIAFIES